MNHCVSLLAKEAVNKTRLDKNIGVAYGNRQGCIECTLLKELS